MTASAQAGKTPPPPRRFPDFVTFAEKWLYPLIAVRLGEAHREGTYTWCAQWWAHRPVSVRIAALHEAFESAVARRDGTSVSTFVTRHVEPHMRVILDAANGPLHRCTRAHHTPHPALTADPVPPGWFGDMTPKTEPKKGEKPVPLRYPTFIDFTEQWLLPVTSYRLAGQGRDGNKTWCRQWWRHHSPCVRFALIHSAFEVARRAEDDTTAYSTLFVDHIDPHLAVILDAGQGPLHRCTPEQHADLHGLPHEQPPLHWFPRSPQPLDRLGFGPDYRNS